MATKAYYPINEIGAGKPGFSKTRSIIEAAFYGNNVVKVNTLKEAYELKELYKKWQRESKAARTITEVKFGLEAFYREVELTQNSAFLKAIKTFKNWQVEILNSYAFGYSNGFLEGINNTSKVIKRNAFGFRKHEHFKAKILLSRV